MTTRTGAAPDWPRQRAPPIGPPLSPRRRTRINSTLTRGKEPMRDPQRQYTITARQAGDCVKALFLALHGTEPSEPIDDRARNRMAAGQAIKPVVSDAMHRQGWEIRAPAPVITIDVSAHLRVTGRPDELARHPNITAGQWIIVQTGSAKDPTFARWLKETSFKTYPHRVAQLALLSRAYATSAEPPEALDLAQPQMITMLNRDTGALEYEPIEPRDLARVGRSIHQNLTNLSDALETAVMPDAPYPRTSRNCAQCQFFTLCQGVQPEPAGEEGVTKEQLQAAIAVIEDLFEEVEAAKPKTGLYDRTKRVIRQYMLDNDLNDLQLEGETRSWKAHLNRDAQVRINVDLARKTLSKADMATISTTSHIMNFGPA